MFTKLSGRNCRSWSNNLKAVWEYCKSWNKGIGFDKDGKIILADEFSPDNCRLWDADGNHMDKDVFRRGLGELTDVYEVVWEKLQGLK